ncbi:hypothetical protein ABEB36_015848, partial [Hypothenemus hampei]
KDVPKEEKFTVQGGAPVPVGATVITRAVPDRQPVTEVENTPTVDPMAVGGGTTTGKETEGPGLQVLESAYEEEMFAPSEGNIESNTCVLANIEINPTIRRSSLIRTPPDNLIRQNTYNLNKTDTRNESEDDTLDPSVLISEEVMEVKPNKKDGKRYRDKESPKEERTDKRSKWDQRVRAQSVGGIPSALMNLYEQSPKQGINRADTKIAKMSGMIDQLYIYITNLEKTMSGMYKPKQELKEVTTKLVKAANRLKQESLGDVLQEVVAMSKLQEENETLKKELERIKKEREDEIMNQHTYTTMKQTTKYIHTLPKINTYTEYKNIVNNVWTEEVYTNTETRDGDIKNTKDQTTIVILSNKNDKDSNDKIPKIIKDRFPEILDMKEDISILEQESKIREKERK